MYELAILAQDFVWRHLAVVYANDQGVFQRLIADMARQPVIQKTVSSNEPWRSRAIDEHQQHADKCERDQPVPVFFSLFVQYGLST